MNPQPTNPIEVFYSYAHEDEKLRDELKKHLSNLKRQGVITDWYDRDILAGKEWDTEIKQHLDSSKVILLLISPDFMDSAYCNDVELKRAMERHEAKEARVIPVILRPVDWKGAMFSKLEALPTDAKPIASWDDRDEAFLDVTKGIRKAIAELSGPSAGIPTLPDIPRSPRVGFISRRDKEGHDIVERLRSELVPLKNQLVALWGAGGVGKTALAAEAVRSISESSGQRLVWITADARPNFAFSTLLDEIAEQLGRSDLRPLGLGPKEEALRPVIASAPTLIALDNLETISPEEEMLCKNFLARRAQCPALITTRERIDDAYLIPLAAMSADEAAELLKRLINQSPDPEIYVLVDHDRILRTAEYNPLIIQWIVAQIDLAQNPEEVLRDLAQGEGDAAERVFDRSFNLKQLDNGGRAVLLALSLFVPSAGRKALAEVAGINKEKDRKRFRDAIRTLSSLWLLRTAAAGERLAVEGLTRQLTEAHLIRDPRSKVFRERFVARFLRFAEGHARQTTEDYDALEFEKDNLFRTIDIAYGMNDWGSVMRLVTTVVGGADGDGMLVVRGYWEEKIRYGIQALEAAKAASSQFHIGAFAHELGSIFSARGDYYLAREHYECAAGIARLSENKQGLAATLHSLGMVAADQGDIGEARRLYDESLQINMERGDELGIARTFHHLAILSHSQGDLSEAGRLYNQSLEIEKRLDDQVGMAGTLHQLATLAKDQGEMDEARRLYNESLEIERGRGDQGGIAASLHQLAIVTQLQGELDEARQLYKDGLEIQKKLGNQSGIASGLHQLAIVAQDQGDFDEARRLYDESLEIKERLGNQSGIAIGLHQLGVLAHYQGELDEARRLYNESLKIERKLGNQRGIADSLHQLARLAHDQGEIDEARQLYNESLQIARKRGDQDGIATSLHELGRLAEQEGNTAEAAQHFNEAIAILVKLGSSKAELAQRSLERTKDKSS